MELEDKPDVKLGQVFYSHNYKWEVINHRNELMFYSKSDGWERYCKVTWGNFKGMKLINN